MTDKQKQAKHTPDYVIRGYPGYLITGEARVFSMKTNWRGHGVREMKQTPNSDGYPSVRLKGASGKRVHLAVHRIMAIYYLGVRPTPNHEIRHLDGDKTNNNISNLAWGTQQDNANDRERHGRTSRGQKHSIAIKKGLPNVKK